MTEGVLKLMMTVIPTAAVCRRVSLWGWPTALPSDTGQTENQSRHPLILYRLSVSESIIYKGPKLSHTSNYDSFKFNSRISEQPDNRG